MKKNIQKIYPLTSMQEGMLFHSLNEEENAYFTQFEFTAEGNIDPKILRQSMSVLSARHDIFRTAFVYDRTEKPIQVVLKNREIEFFIEDISHLSAENRSRHIQSFLDKDRARGFDLTKEPLLRISVFKVEPDKHEFIWSNHHILLDGWCFGIVIKELDLIYNALAKEEPLNLEPAIPFSNYVKWLEEQNIEEAAQFWGNYVKDYNSDSLFPADLTPDENEPLDRTEVKILNIPKDKTEPAEYAILVPVTPSG